MCFFLGILSTRSLVRSWRFSLEKSTADCMVLSILRPVTACQSEFACGPFSSILFGGELDSLQCSVLFPKLAPFSPLCLLNDPKLFYVDEMKSGELWYRRSDLQSRQHNRNRKGPPRCSRKHDAIGLLCNGRWALAANCDASPSIVCAYGNHFLCLRPSLLSQAYENEQ